MFRRPGNVSDKNQSNVIKLEVSLFLRKNTDDDDEDGAAGKNIKTNVRCTIEKHSYLGTGKAK